MVYATILSLALWLVVTQVCFGASGTITIGRATLATAAITAGNALMDTTTANAFAAPVGVDFGAYRTGKHILKLVDSANKEVWAYIGATAPGGLEEATDVLSGWNLTSGFTTSGATIGDADTFTATGNYGYISKASILTSGGLYKGSFDADIATSYMSDNNGNWQILSDISNKYVTAGGISFRIYGRFTNDVTNITSMSLYRVTSPATTGALLCSTTTGTRGFIRYDTGFNPNAAMTYYILTGGTMTFR